MTQLSLLDVEGIDEPKKKAYKIEILDVIDENNDGAIDMTDIKLLAKKNKDKIKIRTLRGDGDFRSSESIKCLEESDIVVTNPPFSLFREYVDQLMFYEKKFLIIGNQNAITYKEIFPLIKENKIWLWYNSVKKFAVSDNFEWRNCIIENWKKFATFGNIIWYTNLEHSKRNEEIDLYKKYKSEEYPKYDNYDAIEVSKVDEIPKDYDGAMGVPITFLGKFNPDQFEILGATESEWKWFSNGLWLESHWIAQWVVNWQRVYKRIFIKNKNPKK